MQHYVRKDDYIRSETGILLFGSAMLHKDSQNSIYF